MHIKYFYVKFIEDFEPEVSNLLNFKFKKSQHKSISKFLNIGNS